LYLQNPSGLARAWIALDESTGRTVGVAGAFPRDMFIDGRLRRGYILGDFCIAPESRSLGPALSLQRACLNDLRNATCLDFPSDRMVAIYRRIGIEPTASVIRYVMWLRVDQAVQRFLQNRTLTRGISAFGNALLRYRFSGKNRAVDVEIGVHEGAFDDEFTKLSCRVSTLYPAYGIRSAAYLNWRYVHHPHSSHRLVVARRGEELIGYAVLITDSTEWWLTDIFGTMDRRIITGILSYVRRLAQGASAEKVTASILSGSPFSDAFRAAGFYPRERHPVVISAPNETAGPLQTQTKWFLMHGDRES
jgi:hypothetical protein